METMETWQKWVIGLGATGMGLLALRLFFRSRIYRGNVVMLGKTVIITGANSGLGKETARELARRKARVILACRDVSKGEAAVRDIRRTTTDGELVVKELDLASFKSIRQFAKDVLKESHIDVLINNAAVFQCPFMKTEDKLEMQMGVNHFGHFLLTNLLLDKLKEQERSRIVVVSSGLHKKGDIDFDNLNSERKYDEKAAYSNSKLANNLFSRQLAKQVEGTGVHVYCLHPGMAWTNLGRHVHIPLWIKIVLAPFALVLLKTAWEGCQTLVFCAIDEGLWGSSGKYYGNCQNEAWPDINCDEELAQNLWDVSARIVNLNDES